MMGGLRRFLQRLVSTMRAGRDDEGLDREIASHLLLLEDEYRRRGLSASDARRAARLALGGVDRTKEVHREARSFAWVDETRRDLQYAARMLTSNVGFTLAIGVRIALGAQTRDVLALVSGKGLRLALVGVSIGSFAAIWATRLMSGMLYGFSGFDPIVVTLAGLLLVLLASIASYLPARRATTLDPIVALRQQ